MTRTIAILVFFSAASSGFSQASSNWETIYIKDVGRIKLPPTMEVQNGSYKLPSTTRNDGIVGHEYASDRLVFQQKGLNDKMMEAFNTYVRVDISLQRSETGTWASYKRKLNLTREDIRGWDASLQEEVKSDLAGGEKIIKWSAGREIVVNGMYCFTYSFRKQAADDRITQETGFLFEDNDRAYSLVVMFRPSQADLWEGVLEEMIASFKIER